MFKNILNSTTLIHIEAFLINGHNYKCYLLRLI